MQGRVLLHCRVGGTTERHRIGHPGMSLPTVTPSICMLSQGWAAYPKATCPWAGGPSLGNSCKSLVNQTLCHVVPRANAHTSATCPFSRGLKTRPPASLNHRFFRPTWPPHYLKYPLNDPASFPSATTCTLQTRLFTTRQKQRPGQCGPCHQPWENLGGLTPHFWARLPGP